MTDPAERLTNSMAGEGHHDHAGPPCRECRAAGREEERERIRGLDYRMVEWWNLEGTSYSLVQVVSRHAILDAPAEEE